MIAAMILFLVGLAGLWLFLSARHVVRVSHGEAIGDRPGTALLLIDLQEVFWDRGPYDERTRTRVEAAVGREVALARHEDQPVIALRQEWSTPGTRLIARVMMKGAAIRGTAGTGLAEPFHGMADHVVIKRVQDGFETGELDVVLRVLGIGRLKIAGLDGIHCVAKTAQAALNRGYEVALIRDGIATVNPAAFETVIEALGGQGARVV